MNVVYFTVLGGGPPPPPPTCAGVTDPMHGFKSHHDLIGVGRGIAPACQLAREQCSMSRSDDSKR